MHHVGWQAAWPPGWGGLHRARWLRCHGTCSCRRAGRAALRAGKLGAEPLQAALLQGLCLAAGLDPQSRAEEIDVAGFLRLAEARLAIR